MRKIAVIFGGRSTEHDISIISALQVINNLNKTKFEVVPIYINHDGKWYSGKNLNEIKNYSNLNFKKLHEVCILPSDNFLYFKKIGGFFKWQKLEMAFIIMHGMNGEDGTIQGLLNLSKIPYSSCDVLASALSMDKVAMKNAFLGLDLPIVPYVWFSKFEYEKSPNELIDNAESKLNFPMVVKPSNLGSSIGIKVCKNREELKNAIEVAINFDNKIVIEKAIENLKEINMSVKGVFDEIECSQTEEPINWQSFLSFEDKYISDKTEKRKMPADISNEQLNNVTEMSKTIFKNFFCKGIVRIDFMLDENTDTIYVNEINTIPGSLAFFLWKDKGYNFAELLEDNIRLAEIDKNAKDQLNFDYHSSVLNNVSGNYYKK